MRTSQIRLMAGGTLVVLAAAACGGGSSGGGGGGASAPGVTDTTITIGSTQPLTGPVAPGYSEISRASNAYFQFINANGGINGRKIVYKYVDDAYDPSKTVTQTKTLV